MPVMMCLWGGCACSRVTIQSYVYVAADWALDIVNPSSLHSATGMASCLLLITVHVLRFPTFPCCPDNSQYGL